jgi:hypothetical protein
MIAISPGTRVTSETNEHVVCVLAKEAYGLVVKNVPSYEWRHDRIEVLIDNEIYSVYRTQHPQQDGMPFFNIKEISK